MTSTGSRPYACPVEACGRLFARRNTWTKHFKRAHPDLPVPSTNTAKHKIHFPVGHERPYLTVGPDGEPRYYVLTPTSISPPHGFAASGPPQGAAFSSLNGGHLDAKVVKSELGQRGFRVGRGRRSTARGASGIGRGRPKALSTPIVKLSDTSPFARTPVSASSSFSETSLLGQPVSPVTPLVEAKDVQFANQGGISRTDTSDLLTTPGSAGSQPSSFGGPSSGNINVGYPVHSAYPGYQPVDRNFSAYALPPPPPGMSWYRRDHGVGRSVSAPMGSGMPYVSAPFDNVAGFSANQLSIPASHQAQMITPIFNQMPIMQTYSAPGADAMDPMDAEDDFTREGSPELVDVHAVPSISLTHGQPLATSTPVPYSAMPQNHFESLQQGPTQQLIMPPSQPGRLHSAPPYLTRFNSTPNFHTASTWDNIEPFQGPGGYGDAHSLGGGRSGEDEDWEELENQMISRDASVGIEDPTLSPEDSDKMLLAQPIQLAADQNNNWSQPMTFPEVPRENSLRVFSSASSSISTTSTLVNPPMLDMLSMDVSHGFQPSFFPSQPMPTIVPFSNYQMQHTYPIPVTPWTAMAQLDTKGYHPAPQHQSFMLQSPVNIVPTRSVSQPWISSTPSVIPAQPDVHNITLSTPPQRIPRNDTMQTLGLGLANVNFDDRSQAIITPIEKETEKVETVFPSPDQESGEDEYDGEEDDDSDEDFVPTGRGRPRKTVAGKKRKSRGSTAKRPRKLQI